MSFLDVVTEENTDKETLDPLQVYWDKIKRAEKSYQSAERKRTRIVEQFNQEILPFEEILCQVRYQFIQHLINFLERKSLAAYLKEEVLAWAHAELQQLVGSPFRGGLELSALYQQLDMHEARLAGDTTSSDIDELRQTLSSLFGSDEFDFSQAPEDKEFEKSDAPEDESEKGNSNFSFQDIIEEIQREAAAFFERFHEGTHHDDSEHCFADQNPETTSFKIFDKLYKQLAQRIHPDRATDDKDRAKRHELMLELSQARKLKDVYALLKIAQDIGATTDVSLAEDQINQLLKSLKKKLATLREDKRELKCQSTTDGMIYSAFHSRTNREMNLKFTQHQKALQCEISELTALTNRLSSIKNLKALLDERSISYPSVLDFPF